MAKFNIPKIKHSAGKLGTILLVATALSEFIKVFADDAQSKMVEEHDERIKAIEEKLNS